MKRLVEIKGSKTGFTLIELLVVISIIGILAGILLPALTKAKVAAKVAQTKTEINGLKGAIESYYSTYQRYPTSLDVRKNGVTDPNTPDYTYGTYGVSAVGSPTYAPKGVTLQTTIPASASTVKTNNSELVAILMDQNRAIPSAPVKGNTENRQGQVFLNAKAANDNTSPGVSKLDGVFRDPWGSPYIVTLDLNYDSACRDAFYRNDLVSADPKTAGTGLNGAVKTAANAWEFRTGVMVWSLGPDRAADPSKPANQGANKDNITSW